MRLRPSGRSPLLASEGVGGSPLTPGVKLVLCVGTSTDSMGLAESGWSIDSAAATKNSCQPDTEGHQHLTGAWCQHSIIIIIIILILIIIIITIIIIIYALPSYQAQVCATSALSRLPCSEVSLCKHTCSPRNSTLCCQRTRLLTVQTVK